MTTQADFAELLEKSEELNLKHKTKIIELENQLNHEKIRAKEYESKFKDAVLQSQSEEQEDLLEKLTTKEKELLDCRRQVLELNRRLANTSHAPTQTDLIALARENEELMDSMQEIKSAAISAIIAKEEEIDELQKTVEKYELLQNELKTQYQKYDNLDREYDSALQEKDEEIRQLTQRVARQREIFLHKLLTIQKEASQEESNKLKLLEKASVLEGTVEQSQIIIEEYETKIFELETKLGDQSFSFDKEKARLEMEMEAAKQDLKMFERDHKTLAKIVQELRLKEREARESLKKATKTNEELSYKLNVKKKRENKALKDKITSSFAGVSKNNPVYASFAFRQKDSIVEEDEEETTPKHLGDYPELQQIDGLIENFSFEDLGRKKSDELKSQFQRQCQEPQSQMMKKKITEVSHPSKPDQSPSSPSELLKQIEIQKQNNLRLETEKKQFQTSLHQAYNQVEELNLTIQTLTGQLQIERKGMAELRQKLKKTKKESQLTVELQSLTLHIEKLQMDMVATKLKFAQEAEFLRERYNREKVMWTQKLVQLTDKIAKQDLLIQTKGEQKKKKRGFFS